MFKFHLRLSEISLTLTRLQVCPGIGIGIGCTALSDGLTGSSHLLSFRPWTLPCAGFIVPAFRECVRSHRPAGRSKALFGEKAAMIYAGGLKCQCTGLLTYPPPGRRLMPLYGLRWQASSDPGSPTPVAESRFQKKGRDKQTGDRDEGHVGTGMRQHERRGGLSNLNKEKVLIQIE